MIENPQPGQEVFFTYKGQMRKGVIDAIGTHASAGTPCIDVTAVTEHGAVHPSLHPAFLFSTEQEARAADVFKEGISVLERYIAEATEYAKVAGDPPAWVAKQRQGCIRDFEEFKARQAGRAVQDLAPSLSLAQANKRFAEGMEIFEALRAAHKHHKCADFSQALSDELVRNEKNDNAVATDEHPEAHVAALRALTHGAHGTGIDWDQLERHRLVVGELTVDRKGRVSPDQAAALEGVVNCLDWLCDMAEDVGLLRRVRLPSEVLRSANWTPAGTTAAEMPPLPQSRTTGRTQSRG